MHKNNIKKIAEIMNAMTKKALSSGSCLFTVLSCSPLATAHKKR